MNISIGAIKKIDEIFEKAYKDNRNMLYEHEVYEMLDWVGLDVPKNVYITKTKQITEEVLNPFGEKVVIKVVSRDIIHKQKLGGVKIVNKHDPVFVQYVIDKMKEEILSHYTDTKPVIEGFLIVEFIEFSSSLGNELLFGIKSDRAFGPVLTLSKGGDDAEFFAKYYDPANLILPHLSIEEANKLMNSIKIRHKYNETGHTEYMELIAKNASIISALAYHYSKVNFENTNYYISQADFNPFVFSKSGKFVAVDGYVSFEKAKKTDENLMKVNIDNLVPFFKPDGVAVIGVTSDPNKYSMGKEIAHLMHELDRKDLYCVNPKGGTVQIGNKQYKLYESIDQIEQKVELAIYTAPAKYIQSFFENMKTNIPKAVVLIPGIPSDINYEDFKQELQHSIKQGIRVIGPNCMGTYYGKGSDAVGVNSLFIEEDRLHISSNEQSNVVLLSQSGGMAITMIDKLKNTPVFKAVVSFGNKYDVKITDLIALFENQDNIDVIALYVEGFDLLEGRTFFEMAKQANKPIIVYKGGKTEAGAKAAQSHTASMTGDYEVFKAACEQANVILMEDASMYMNCIKTFSLLSHKTINGMNVAGVLNAGFEATIAADELGTLKMAQQSDETIRRLSQLNTHGLVDTKTSILDVTPMTDDVMYGEYIEAFLKDDHVDCVIVGVVPHVENIKSTPDTCHNSDSLANIVVDLFNKYDKPIIVSVNASEYYGEFVSVMEKGGLPVFSDIRSAVRTLEIYANYKNNQ
ncbi:MAG: acetate--CoA ligase family protein [Clostridia bacterium]|nr:acetate--CoA ligase family protein [Clostridia bacterium]